MTTFEQYTVLTYRNVVNKTLAISGIIYDVIIKIAPDGDYNTVQARAWRPAVELKELTDELQVIAFKKTKGEFTEEDKVPLVV